jgi:hypothetical protein
MKLKIWLCHIQMLNNAADMANLITMHLIKFTVHARVSKSVFEFCMAPKASCMRSALWYSFYSYGFQGNLKPFPPSSSCSLHITTTWCLLYGASYRITLYSVTCHCELEKQHNHYIYMCVMYTYSMEKSPSWEAKQFSASQEFSHILWNP